MKKTNKNDWKGRRAPRRQTGGRLFDELESLLLLVLSFILWQCRSLTWRVWFWFLIFFHYNIIVPCIHDFWFFQKNFKNSNYFCADYVLHFDYVQSLSTCTSKCTLTLYMHIPCVRRESLTDQSAFYVSFRLPLLLLLTSSSFLMSLDYF